MNKIMLIILICMATMTAAMAGDLSMQWDEQRLLENPHKGWYHHYYDNGVWGYKIKDDADLDDFPGMDHIYIRLAWSFLELTEDQYDWSLIDELMSHWGPKGYQFSFRITAKETGDLGVGVNQKVNGVCYATPKWVRDAGAKGIEVTNWGVKQWEPVWDDPIFLAKWEDMHRAFAARYDGHPQIIYIDLGGIGDWGEGHTGFSSNKSPTVKQIQAHINIMKRTYVKTQIIMVDDYLNWSKSAADEKILLDYSISQGLGMRDDSPLVDWWLHDGARKNWGINRPNYFATTYAHLPTILESEHYNAVKSNGNWLGKNGAEVIPSLGISGAEVLRRNIRTLHATYIGFHGYADLWLKENPDLAVELTNLCGYWYFIKSCDFPTAMNPGGRFNLSVTWVNQGVAPAYDPYELHIRLQNEQTERTIIVADAQNRDWLDNSTVTENYQLILPDDLPVGKYALKIKLHDAQKSGRDIDLGMKIDIKDAAGFITLGELDVTTDPMGIDDFRGRNGEAQAEELQIAAYPNPFNNCAVISPTARIEE